MYMNELKAYVTGMKPRDFWNDSNTDIQLTCRILISLAALSILSIPFIMMSASYYATNPQMIYFAATHTWPIVVVSVLLKLAVIVGLKMRNEYAWVGLVVLSSQWLFSALFPLTLVALWWVMRPEFRGEFKEVRVETNAQPSQI